MILSIDILHQSRLLLKSWHKVSWMHKFIKNDPLKTSQVGLKAKVGSVDEGLDGSIYSLVAILTPIQQQMLSVLRALICWTPIVVVDQISDECDPQVSQVRKTHRNISH